MATTTEMPTTAVKVIVTVKVRVGGLNHDVDDVADLLGKSILLEIVSAQLNPQTGSERNTIEGYAHRVGQGENDVKYESDFKIPDDFGEIGAVLVENGHYKEMFIEKIVFNGFALGPVNVTCNSWVASKFDVPEKRIFFTNKSYLPSQTPNGLTRLREMELQTIRGNGEGERKKVDRIYDYDVYNDLGNPDSKPELKRPVLGGKELPYPRRCRTSRPPCQTDPNSESRSVYVYVPRDEAFSEVKQLTFSAKAMYLLFTALGSSPYAALVDTNLSFPDFTAIDSLFNEGFKIPQLARPGEPITDPGRGVALRFETPATFRRARFSWMSDEEFSRETLAGVNPCSIQLVTEWPLMSKLDPNIYGPPESAITKETVEQEIGGFMTIEEAINEKKLFMLDYHDLLLPYVNKVREIKGTTLYGSRTLFFLTPGGSTLRPIAIELTRPPAAAGMPQWKQVFTPASDAPGCWLWRLAKTHVLAHDSAYHELVSHWLRTHCVTEPYVIATNRQLSAMHPIYRLLHPYFRYTMEINGMVRKSLISADGIIESSFSPTKYSMELSSVAYDQQWRFDFQALPADLINRGMAVEDPNSQHGLKLTIEDYPFANDGLLIWDAIKRWVTSYVKHYYPEEGLVESDKELQAWWEEIRTVGHGDKKDGWPQLKTPCDLTGILTTMIWVASGHHSAVNFGQYAYGGYFPDRPTIARTKMPTEDPSDEELELFRNNPEDALLQCLPSQIQATKVMAVLDLLSTHSPDEVYIGEKIEATWEEDPVIKEAFKVFSARLREVEGIIDARNADRTLKNRCGAGVVSYELLKPFSEPGLTGRGVPNGITI